MNLTEGNKTISNDDELCQVFNNFFSKTVDELKIPNISNYKLDNPFKEALKYFENHPSITNIKSKCFVANFTFRDTSSGEFVKLIKTLAVKKTSQKSDIPIKIVKLNADFLGNFIYKNFNYCLKKGEFPCVLKYADGGEFGAFFTDLSKAFDCIDSNLLITKLTWYRVTPK